MTLREFRKARGLSLEEVAYLAGVDIATVSRVERGLSQPRPWTAIRLARALGTSPSRVRAMLAAGASDEGDEAKAATA